MRFAPFAFALVLAGCGSSTPSAPPASAPPPARPSGVKELSYKAPAEWVEEKPSNAMRKAQYRVPDRNGRADAASLTLFSFGGPASSLESNIERWQGQMGGGEPDVKKVEGAACPTTVVDIAGTYSADDQAKPLENARLLVGVVETSRGTWYFKLVGPAATIDGWKIPYLDFLKGVRAVE